MNSISIDGKSYSKATDIARELGYTADYVGQLCRAGKVDAQLVGRSWYVSEDSIRAHKKTRYRNDKKATHKTISHTLDTVDVDGEDSFSVPVSVQGANMQRGHTRKQFNSHAVAKKVKHNYYADDSDLIPTSSISKNRNGSLNVSHVEIQKVKIVSKSKEYDFDPTPRPEIRFSGALSISEVDSDEELEHEEVQKIQEDALTQKIPVQRRLKKAKVSKTKDSKVIKVVHKRTDKKKKRNLPKEQNEAGIIGMTADRISDRNPMGGTLKVAVPTSHASVSRTGHYLIVATFVFSTMLSAVMVGLQSVTSVENATMVTSYLFEIQTLIAAVSSAW